MLDTLCDLIIRAENGHFFYILKDYSCSNQLFSTENQSA